MKNFFIVLVFACTTLTIQAQKKEKNQKPQVYGIDSTKVTTIDKTIKSLYDVVSGEKGEKRNWGQFKFLFYKDAKLIPSGKNKKKVHVASFMTPDDYVKNSGKWLVENGFFEKEINRKVQRFGNIAHVFSTYEAFNSKSDDAPFMRGINSIQLLNDGKRWWIINIYWTQETTDNPIPEKYLPKK
ncbi:hypothetical protein [Seonamhaeicola maritimus]|uniref:Nuclear transport factor 2 family protein n=1 Tax=Seonamhaeicola maritimus TaxID=2591822 RepID=A0A5C7GLF4_9FLAO|nr:hypothetical protein [Seonamhaeicola maritimus]TXG39316.1 hypothetical protein FUA22_05420 [Seonamhaeicola maritimus]